MAIIQCPNNHYYDDKRNSSCPYCADMNKSISPESFNEQLTSYIVSNDDDACLTEAYGDCVENYEKTISIFSDDSFNILTVGWIVCISKLSKGMSYVIHSGRNFAGRSSDMDIVLTNDNQIRREKHFSIVYDPKSVNFYVVAGEGYVYVNDKVVNSEIEIYDGDIIQAGESKYMFIPFCKKGREWN